MQVYCETPAFLSDFLIEPQPEPDKITERFDDDYEICACSFARCSRQMSQRFFGDIKPARARASQQFRVNHRAIRNYVYLRKYAAPENFEAAIYVTAQVTE